jgi:hypothetical protein
VPWTSGRAGESWAPAAKALVSARGIEAFSWTTKEEIAPASDGDESRRDEPPFT